MYTDCSLENTWSIKQACSTLHTSKASVYKQVRVHINANNIMYSTYVHNHTYIHSHTKGRDAYIDEAR